MLIFWLCKGGEWTPKVFRTAYEWSQYKQTHDLYIQYLDWRIERRAIK